VRYDFVVPMFMSGYTIRVKDRKRRVGYHGSFWADSETHELVRLEMTADDIPPSLGVVSANDAMEYERVRIGASDFLLPQGSELVMTDMYGNESRNRTTFNSCKQYSGESVLIFAEAPEEEPVESAPEPVEDGEGGSGTAGGFVVRCQASDRDRFGECGGWGSGNCNSR
jgi:hypothetical protein